MTNDEWNKYVQRIAKTVNTPSCDIPAIKIKGTFQWKSWKKDRPIKVHVEPIKKVEPDKEIRIVTKYETKVYEYNGRTYKRKWVK
jgi:hypothetical protein